MTLKRFNNFGWIVVIAGWMLLADALSADTEVFRVAVVMSGNIKPYVEAMSGLAETLQKDSRVSIERFNLEELSDKQKESFKQQVSENSVDVMITIGPEAAQFCQFEPSQPRIPIVRSMILRPEKDDPQHECGVFLNIPVPVQFQEIITAFPGTLRVGLMFDPKHNQSFFEKALESAEKYNIAIVPLQVDAKKDIPVVLKQTWNSMDILWLIPDRTVISESIVQYIIKESLLKKIPVVGFNRFFYESGAALSFVFNYFKLGNQTGELAIKVLSGDSCDAAPPVFESLINEKVRDKLLKK